MKLCIYEDMGYENLYPAAHLKPVYDLRCGFSSLKDKIIMRYPDLPVILHSREVIANVVSLNRNYQVNRFENDDHLFVNGRVLCGEDFSEKIDLSESNKLFYAGDTVIAAVVSAVDMGIIKENADTPLQLDKLFPEYKSTKIEVDIIEYPWDIIFKNSNALISDFRSCVPGKEDKEILFSGIHVLNKDEIFISDSARIQPGVVIDAENGPVYIDDNVRIMPNTVITGPVYIGRNTLIKAGAKIYGGTSIGETCKIGGEVESSVIQGFSNKQHDGFLGHSFLGEWINIGAGTNNSDLKNNYNDIKVHHNGKQIDTGEKSLGLIMGDHSKTGINTMFNTGTIVGSFCNIFGSGFPPKFIPSFSWGGKDNFTEYDLDKAVNTAKIVMVRRNKELSEEFECLICRLHQNTADDRASFIKHK